MSANGIAMHRVAVRVSPARLARMLGGPVAIALGSWVYLAVMIDDMKAIPGMRSMMMPSEMPGPGWLIGLFLMWTVMMAAMMLPTAVPMLLAYARMRAGDRTRRAIGLSVTGFAAGYVAAWSCFSLVAALLQAGMTHLALLSPMGMQVVSGPLASGVFVAAGLYQLMPLKQSCLRQCQTPMAFLMTRWRDGPWGSFAMGSEHGLFCVGCCWALMALLFVAGVMNPIWIIAITTYVLVEKLVPGSRVLSKWVGLGLVGVGIWTLLA